MFPVLRQPPFFHFLRHIKNPPPPRVNGMAGGGLYGVRDRRGIFRPRARYFPRMESTQRSSGLRPRTPDRTFGKGAEFVRRGHELGAVPFSARCRSCRSNQVVFLSPYRASRVPCLFGSIWLGSPPTMHNIRFSHSVGPDDPYPLWPSAISP